MAEENIGHTGQARRNEPMDTLENDAYLLSCRCPACRGKLSRGYAEAWKYCGRCGQRLHFPAFSESEIAAARFENECDEYCT